MPGQSKKTSVLFQSEVNGKFKWFENGDEDKDVKYVGEIKKWETKWSRNMDFP